MATKTKDKPTAAGQTEAAAAEGGGTPGDGATPRTAVGVSGDRNARSQLGECLPFQIETRRLTQTGAAPVCPLGVPGKSKSKRKVGNVRTRPPVKNTTKTMEKVQRTEADLGDEECALDLSCRVTECAVVLSCMMAAWQHECVTA